MHFKFAKLSYQVYIICYSKDSKLIFSNVAFFLSSIKAMLQSVQITYDFFAVACPEA